MPPELLGPTGLVAAALAAVAVLWREHLRTDKDVRDERNEWRELALAEQRDGSRLTAAVEAALGIKVPPR